MISDPIVFTVQSENDAKEYEIDNNVFRQFSDITPGGDIGELDRDEFKLLLSYVIEEEDIDLAPVIADSVFDQASILDDISFKNLDTILDGKTLNIEQDLDDALAENMTYNGREGDYSPTSIPGVMIREKESGAAYIDKEFRPALDEYYQLAVDNNEEEAALETILSEMGFDDPEAFVQLIIERANEKGMDPLEYLYSHDGAVSSAALQGKSGADLNLSASEIALASFVEDDGYNVENFTEAYDALSLDDRNLLVNSLLYTEGQETGGNPIKGLSGEEAALELFGATTGTADFRSVEDYTLI